MPVNTDDKQRFSLLQKYPLKGRCKGMFAFFSEPEIFLQSLLPQELELAPQSYTPPGQHPLLIMFNNTWLTTNANLEKLATSPHFGLNLNYYEFIVMLPYVQFKDSDLPNEGPYCYLPVLYLNSLAAVLGGRLFWEFNKEMADFSVQPGDFTVSKFPSRTKLISGVTKLTGSREPGKSIANFREITPILQLPVIEHGPYGYVSSIYKIVLENTDITPAEIEMNNISSAFLPPGVTHSPPITGNPLGTFLMDYDWELSYIKFIKF